jgi:hypothetical protein
MDATFSSSNEDDDDDDEHRKTQQRCFRRRVSGWNGNGTAMNLRSSLRDPKPPRKPLGVALVEKEDDPKTSCRDA